MNITNELTSFLPVGCCKTNSDLPAKKEGC